MIPRFLDDDEVREILNGRQVLNVLVLARQAIDGVSTLHSVAVRREMLIPLAAALEARPSTDTRELVRTARKVAATRI